MPHVCERAARKDFSEFVENEYYEKIMLIKNLCKQNNLIFKFHQSTNFWKYPHLHKI